MKGGIEHVAIQRLGTHPLTDEHGNWSAGGEPMNKGDECWFVAWIDLDRYPRMVRVSEVATYSERPDANGEGTMVGRASIQAVPTAIPDGESGHLVISDTSHVRLSVLAE